MPQWPAALEAGKHVFVEKPLALSSAAAASLVQSAAQAGLVLMVGHLLQYLPAFLMLRELVADRRLGRLQYLYSNRLNLGKFGAKKTSSGALRHTITRRFGPRLSALGGAAS